MSPDQFSLMQCLDYIEREEGELEQARDDKEAQANMLQGFLILGCPKIVPVHMVPGWMQENKEQEEDL